MPRETKPATISDLRAARRTTNHLPKKQRLAKQLCRGLLNGGGWFPIPQDHVASIREALVDVSKDERFWNCMKAVYGHRELADAIAEEALGVPPRMRRRAKANAKENLLNA